MMTKYRKQRLQMKIRESRGRIMEKQPFFTLMLMYLKFVAVPGMKRISTNGRCIYFSPDFLDRLHAYELDYILCHQIMHIAYEHIWRHSDLAGFSYHLACDIQVNAALAKNGILRDKYSHMGYTFRAIPGEDKDVSEMTTEEIYAQLPYGLHLFDERIKDRYIADSDCHWDQKEDYGALGEVILESPEEDALVRNKEDNEKGISCDDVSSGEDFREVWRNRMAAAANALSVSAGSMQDAGSVPESIKRIIEKIKEPVVDWKKTLINFVQERISDYSFSPPDRRYADFEFFLPDFNEKDFVSKEVLFMADTSGSVSNDELACVYSEIKGAIEQFGGKLTGKLGFFDADVTPPRPFETVGDLLQIVPYGGGGTDFRVIFEYVRMQYQNELPACVVIFTDGRGPYPPETEAIGIPVLWMLNNIDVNPPWGKIVRVLSSG